MLNKNDLAKQFELVVKQEIKNYQDSLNFVLQSIRDIKNEIQELKQDFLDNHAAIHALQVDMGIELKKNISEMFSLSNKIDANRSDQNLVNTGNEKRLQDVYSEISRRIFSEIETHTEIFSLKKTVGKIQQDSKSYLQNLSEQSNSLINRFQKNIENLRKEMSEEPKESEVVKKQLEEKIDSHKIDVSGVMREINVFKHNQMIVEKKLENIYILIERLQKKGD